MYSFLCRLFAAALFLLALPSLAQEDPPAQVARLSLLEGTVQLRSAHEDLWQMPVLNWPITNGDRLRTGPAARAEIRAGSTVLRLDGDSELEIERLDGERLELRLEGGSLAVRVRYQDQAEAFLLVTSHGDARLRQPGSYRFDLTDQAVTVTAHDGVVEFTAEDETLVLQSPSRTQLWHAGGLQYLSHEPRRDEFDDWNFALDERDDALYGRRYVSREMTGNEDLYRYGEWRETEQYGVLWYPPVAADWAPYRTGRWIWVRPWGWIWVDEAPWGFAPFHYGRWLHLHGKWAWAPGKFVSRPVFAPALVVWLDGTGVAVTSEAPVVGWLPLGPGEVFLPPYPASHAHIRGINFGHVHHVDFSRVHQLHPHFVNRHIHGAITAVPIHEFRHAHRVVKPHVIRSLTGLQASFRPPFHRHRGSKVTAGVEHRPQVHPFGHEDQRRRFARHRDPLREGLRHGHEPRQIVIGPGKATAPVPFGHVIIRPGKGVTALPHRHKDIHAPVRPHSFRHGVRPRTAIKPGGPIVPGPAIGADRRIDRGVRMAPKVGAPEFHHRSRDRGGFRHAHPAPHHWKRPHGGGEFGFRGDPGHRAAPRAVLPGRHRAGLSGIEPRGVTSHSRPRHFGSVGRGPDAVRQHSGSGRMRAFSGPSSIRAGPGGGHGFRAAPRRGR